MCCNIRCNLACQCYIVYGPDMPRAHSERGKGAADGSGAMSIAGTGFGYNQPCPGCAAEQ